MISTLIALALVSKDARPWGLLVPRAEPYKLYVDWYDKSYSRKTILSVPLEMYRNSDHRGDYGNQFLADSCCVTVSPDTNQIFVPHIHVDGVSRLTISGLVMNRSGLIRYLRPISVSMKTRWGQFYLGWSDARTPSIIFCEEGSVQWTIAWKNLKPKTVATLPALYEQQRVSDHILGRYTGRFAISVHWLDGGLEAGRSIGDPVTVGVGPEGKVALTMQGSSTLISATGTRTVEHPNRWYLYGFPFGESKLVGRDWPSMEPRKVFDGLYVDKSDPFFDSSVYVLDFKTGIERRVGPGIMGLPVRGVWRSQRFPTRFPDSGTRVEKAVRRAVRVEEV